MKEIHDYKKNLKEGNIGDVTQGMYLKSKKTLILVFHSILMDFLLSSPVL